MLAHFGGDKGEDNMKLGNYVKVRFEVNLIACYFKVTFGSVKKECIRIRFAQLSLELGYECQVNYIGI